MSSLSKIERQASTRVRLSRSAERGWGWVRSQLWLWPLAAAVLLLLAGLWIRRSIEAAATQDVADEMQTILNLNVEALRIWLDTEKAQVRAAADEVAIRKSAGELSQLVASADDDVPQALAQSPALEDLKAALRPLLASRRYAGFALIDKDGLILACDRPELVGQTPASDHAELVAKALTDGATVSKPFRSVLLTRDERGQMRAGQPTMFAAAPVRDLTGDVVGVLGLRIRPEDDFNRLLHIAQQGESAEVYAFDKSGLLLSESRFTDQLVAMGLVPDEPGARSQLTVTLRDPGADLTTGARATKPRAAQPLTVMAASAVKGESGVNVAGYRDYRGVPVVGAWTWLTDYDMGVTSEVDYREAYSSVNILRRGFWSLFGLLGACSLLVLLFGLANSRLRKSAQRAALAAKELGQYQLETKLGEGGMGVVYRGRHKLLRRPTAIKLLHPDKTTDEAIARFEREVQLTCQLNHPNTIAIYDYGRTPEGLFFYAMEYLDGINLEALVARYGHQPEGRVIHILRQVCGSLAEAHAAGVVHRDIKPANLILTRRGGEPDVVKVLDFGLVKAIDAPKQAGLTAANVVMGTPHYLSPEAVEAPDQIDGRSDLYAVAAVGYFLLTGTPPFDGKSIVEICMHHARTPPQRPSERIGLPVEADLEAVILRGLAKSPADRYANARDFADALSGCAAAATWTTRQANAWWDALQLPAVAEPGSTVAIQVHQAPTMTVPADARPSGG